MKHASRIFVIGLSNIGDAILMSPVIERLHRGYPHARLTLLIGERARGVFVHDPRIHQLVCLEDEGGWMAYVRLWQLLWTTHPDLIVDLRTTILPLLWRPWRILRYFWPVPRHVTHMRARHLWKLLRQAPSLRLAPEENGCAVWVAPEERTAAEQLMRRWGLDPAKPLVLVCPGARSHIKRWDAEPFAQLADRLIEELGVELIFAGEPDEAPIIAQILTTMRHRAHNAVGHTTIRHLAALMQRARLVMTNDSAALHLACAMQAPVLALFGPTDPRKYGPTGPRDRVIQRTLFCAPCEHAQCRFHHECMRFITADEVYRAAKEMLEGGG